jgi:hypothetical protein
MALNLSTLTSPATSGDVLAEALTTADFLEPFRFFAISRGVPTKAAMRNKTWP